MTNKMMYHVEGRDAKHPNYYRSVYYKRYTHAMEYITSMEWLELSLTFEYVENGKEIKERIIKL